MKRIERKLRGLWIGVILGIMIMAVPGCGLFPKNVEFFQKKVEAVPTKSAKQLEKEKQAAQYVNVKVNEARDAALQDGASTNVITPITDAKLVSYALTTSLGPPQVPWQDSSAELSRLLLKEISNLNTKLDKYTDRVEKLEGKKIEGTGLIQMGYFTYIGGIFIVGLIAYMGLKLYGSINPAVGVGLGLFERISGSVAKKAVKQVVAGNEAFKDVIDNIVTDASLRDTLLEEFRKAQTSKQDESIQNIIRLATSKK